MTRRTPPRHPAEETCARCGGLGFYVDDATNTTYRCDCGMETTAFRLLMAGSGIPAMFREATFDNFIVPPRDDARRQVLEAARAYATSVSIADPEGLVLRGEPGTGKTHLAVAILRMVMARGLTACYRGFNDLLTQIRNSYDPAFPMTEEEILRPLGEAQLLVLDDLGSETPKDFVRDRLYLIINTRYERQLPLIITTNCDEAELEARIGKRTASRLREMCSAPFVPFPRDDWRVRKATAGAPGPTGARKPGAPPADPRVGRMK